MSYLPPHLRKSFSSKTTASSFKNQDKKNKDAEKQFTLVDKDFPTIEKEQENKKSGSPKSTLLLENSFVKVATKIVEVKPTNLIQEQVYDKTIYKKNHFLKKKPTKMTFPPRQFDVNGWMENDDFIDWFEYNFPHKVGTF